MRRMRIIWPMTHRLPLKHIPAIPQFRTGIGRFEHNNLVSQYRQTGSAGTPGKLFEMIHAWPHLRAAVKRDLAAVGSLGWETSELEDETTEEREFNDALERLFDSRLYVQTGDGFREGHGEYLRQLRWASYVGFALLDPYWETGAGLFSDDRLLIHPLLQAAVHRFPAEGPAIRSVEYVHQNGGRTSIPYDGLIHLAHDAPPGLPFGRGELRSLVAPYEAFQNIVFASMRSDAVSSGVVIGTDVGHSRGEDSRAAMETTLRAMGEGQTWAIEPDHDAIRVMFPSGTPPKWGERINTLNAMIDRLFGEEALSLGTTQTGSRAVGESLRAESAESGRDLADVFVSAAYYKFAAWVANEEEYGGRIRRIRSVGEDAVDQEQRTNILSTAIQSGQLTWTGDDETARREELGLGERAETGDSDATKLNGAQITAAADVVAQVSQGLIPESAARQLLIAAGIPADRVSDMLPQSESGDRRAEPNDEPEPNTEPEPLAVSDVDLTPTQEMADAARRALGVRDEKPKSQQGMTRTGLARANQLIDREELSPDTVRRMLSFFERHEVDKQGETWGDQGKGWQAWHGWGGDPGFAWAKRKVKELDRARGEERASVEPCGHTLAERREMAGDDEFMQRMERLFNSALDSGLESVRAVASEQRDRFVSEVERAIERGDIEAVVEAAADMPDQTNEYANAIEEHLVRVADEAESITRAEIEEQLGGGLSSRVVWQDRLAEGLVEEIKDKIRAFALSAAIAIGSQFRNKLRSAAIEAAQGGGMGALVTALPSDTFAGGEIQSVTSKVIGATRDAVPAQMGVDVPEIERDEVLDANTCGPCREIDGRRFVVGSDEYELVRYGAYARCMSVASGQNRCRGVNRLVVGGRRTEDTDGR